MGSETVFDFTRNYPFDEETKFNVLISTAENWAEQRRLKSTKTKKIFTCNFYPLTLTEANAIKAYFEARYGPYEQFKFDNPLDGIRYDVRFVDDNIKISRVAFNTFKLSILLQSLRSVAIIMEYSFDAISITENVSLSVV